MKDHHTKRKIAITILLAIWLLMAASRLMAQTAINYDHYADNLTPVNPAYSLLDEAGAINILGRKQFLGVDGAPTSFLFSGYMPVKDKHASAGIFVLNDQYGVTHQTELNAFFAKAIQISAESYLAVSINAGLHSYSASYTQLDATDPQFSADVKETSPNLGLGAMYYSNNYYVGFSVPQFYRHTNTAKTDLLKSIYYLSGAYVADISDDIKLRPATLVACQSGAPAILNLSATVFMKDMFGIGANYSTTKQVAGMLSVRTRGFSLGYSYEFGTSSGNLAGFNNATNEVSLSYRFGKNAGKLL